MSNKRIQRVTAASLIAVSAITGAAVIAPRTALAAASSSAPVYYRGQEDQVGAGQVVDMSGDSSDANFALLRDGSVLAWGGPSGYGMLGYYGATSRDMTKPLKLPVSNVSQIVDDPQSVTMLLKDGSVVYLGTNYGMGMTTTPRVVPALGPYKIKQMSEAFGIGVFLTDEGVPIPGSSMGNAPRGKRIGEALIERIYPGISHVRQVAVSGRIDQYNNYALMLLNDGTVKAVGTNSALAGYSWQTIDGVSVGTAPISGVKQVVAGAVISYYLTDNGDLYALGTAASPSTPVKLLSDVKMLSASKLITSVVAVKKDGTVVGMGYDQYNKFGLPSGIDSYRTTWTTLPWQDPVSVSDGRDDLFLVMPDGSVQAAGYSSNTYRLGTIQTAVMPFNLITGTLTPTEVASNAVSEAEAKPNLTNISFANRMVSVLTEDAKAPFLARLNALSDIVANASAIVAKAEASNNQNDVYVARDVVSDVSDAAVKNGLWARLDAVQNKINNANAEKLQTAAEKAVSKGLNEIAYWSISALPASTEKTALLDRNTGLNRFLGASAAVAQAETSKTLATAGAARTAVDALPDGDIKQSLHGRLDVIVQAQANLFVSKVETSKLVADLTAARQWVTLVRDVSLNTALTDRLDVVQLQINMAAATQAVTNAETAKTAASVATARPLVNAIPDGDSKTSLHGRLDALVLPQANAGVVKAETSQIMADVTAAREWVKLVRDTETMQALSDRLDTVQLAIAIKNDNRAPLAPVIANNDSLITISATDLGGKVGSFAQVTEGFEASTFAFPFPTSWPRTTAQKYSGSYAVKSPFISHSQQANADITFTVPQGVTNANVSLKYLVRSEQNYDFFKVILDGTVKTQASGYGSWTIYTLNVAPGTHTLRLQYIKDGSVSSYEDTVFIDALSIPYGTEVTYPASGIDKIEYKVEYKIGDGEWLLYEGPFTPNLGGLVNISARATDKAGLVSPVTTVQVEIKDNFKKQANDILDQVEPLLLHLDTQGQLDDAATKRAEAQAVVNQMPAGQDRTDLQNRIDACQQVVEAAQGTLNATNAVEPLNNEARVTADTVAAAKTKVVTARSLVSSLKDSASKDALILKVEAAERLLQQAEAILAVKTAEGHAADLGADQNLIDQAQNLHDDALTQVNALPTSDIQTALHARLEAVQVRIDTAQATMKVEGAEAAAVDLSAWDKADAAQAAHDDAIPHLNKLTEGNPVKVGLSDRLAAVQLKIDQARATIKVEGAEAAAVDLSDWDKADAAQTAHDDAIPHLNKLTEGNPVKVGLSDRLAAVQLKIDQARASIKTQTAESTITQADVDAAWPYVNILPTTDAVFVDLTARLTYVQSVIDATNQVVASEGTLDAMVNSFASTQLTVKGKRQVDALVTKLQGQVDFSKAQSAKADSMTNAIAQTDKAALSQRLADLKNRNRVVSGFNNSLQTIVNRVPGNKHKTKGNSDHGGSFQQDDMDDFATQFSSEITTALGNVKWQPSDQDDDSVQSVVNRAQDNMRKAKLPTNLRFSFQRATTADLATQFSSEITTALGSNVKWQSFDLTAATIDAGGKVTALKNGMVKITAYSDLGTFDFFVTFASRDLRSKGFGHDE